MKKVLLIAVVAAFGFTSVYAQGIRLGAKAGLNLASVSGDDADGFDGRTSSHFGAVAHIGISEKFAVQPELIYSAQGATADDDITAKLDYLNLPILAGFSCSRI